MPETSITTGRISCIRCSLIIHTETSSMAVTVLCCTQKLEVRKQEQRLENLSSEIPEDEDFPRGQQHWAVVCTDCMYLTGKSTDIKQTAQMCL